MTGRDRENVNYVIFVLLHVLALLSTREAPTTKEKAGARERWCSRAFGEGRWRRCPHSASILEGAHPLSPGTGHAAGRTSAGLGGCGLQGTVQGRAQTEPGLLHGTRSGQRGGTEQTWASPPESTHGPQASMSINSGKVTRRGVHA